MAEHGFTLFDTAIGRCGIAWGSRGVVRVQLPEARERDTRDRLLRGRPEAREGPPPADVQRAVDDIRALLRGEPVDLSAVRLDMARVPAFHRRVYEAARTIPPGCTRCYGDVAAQLGARGLARAVGHALGRNPFAIVVPCHRVLAAGRRVGGFSANGGTTTKLRLLSIEGAGAGGAPALFDDGALSFDPVVAVEHVRASDAVLGRVIDAVGPFGLQLRRTPSLFLALVEAIVHQQLTARAADTIFGRVRALFPHGHVEPAAEEILRVGDEQLRAAGLSRAKVLALRDLASRAAEGAIPTLAEARRMEDEAIIGRLTTVRGIGRWTVEMLLIFHLGRPDVLPAGDYGIRRGLAVACRRRALPARDVLERRGRRWQPYRTVASWYLWRAAELARR